MKYLLDTHALLFWLYADKRLTKRAQGIISDRGNNIFVSSASAWEIATKWRLGRLPGAAALVQDMSSFIAKAGFTELSITVSHSQRAGTWPQPHRDPFDRMLAAQSALEGMPLVSADAELGTFGVALVW